MHVDLHATLANDKRAQQAAELTTACVHCGFCLETCPTYLDRRDERDSPRGRIYLIKQLLESGEATDVSQTHLDRCLTCRNCETTCPSGVQYAQLLDIGRSLVEPLAPRPLPQRALRALLRRGLTQPAVLACGLWLARLVRPLLPQALARKIPPRQSTGKRPVAVHARKMLILEGCVQRAATPRTNACARRVLDKLGITLVSAAQAGCCGALNHHLNAQREALEDLRRNIDAWTPALEDGIEAIVSTASGCGVMLADYGRLLADDPDYAQRAARVSALHKDLCEVLLDEDLNRLQLDTTIGKVAVHTPCTLQHGQALPHALDDLLSAAGFTLGQHRDGHLCCGSAGTYSILHPGASERLREQKLQRLLEDSPTLIASANIGCQMHLQAGTSVSVKHWIELFDSDA